MVYLGGMKIPLSFFVAVVMICFAPSLALSQGLIEGEVGSNQTVLIQTSFAQQNWIELGRSLQGTYGGQCVAFIQRFYGSYFKDPSFRGYAGDIQSNSQIAAIGEAVLLTGKVGHTALIVGMDEKYLTLLESNLRFDERVTYGRRIERGSPKIRGYFRF